jgi:hypothetical protein
VKDERYADKSPHTADEQDAPEPERPVGEQERAGEQKTPDAKPSQAEGERDRSAE